ncbi:MAG: penicillin-binding protein, partial [Rhizobiaceae bacterium]|nr:penicillin-binding protein [Rhizobiaceae bacterium]
IRIDAPVRIGNWTPKNYDKKYRGEVTLTTALSKSLNTIAAQLVMEVGPKTIVATAHRLGIESTLHANASIALGTSEVNLLELTGAYVPFSNGGFRVTPHIIKRVKDMNGNILFERKSENGDLVVGPRELGMMNTMLRDVVENGTGKAASIQGRQVAGKTGTSQNSRDGLFIGYTANLVTGVWYGNDNGKPTKKVTGGTIPAQSWKSFMAVAHKNLPMGELPGSYVSAVTIIPTARPSRNVGDIITNANRTVQIANRKPRQNSGLRPVADLTGTNKNRQKPKTILDLIFGG